MFAGDTMYTAAHKKIHTSLNKKRLVWNRGCQLDAHVLQYTTTLRQCKYRV